MLRLASHLHSHQRSSVLKFNVKRYKFKYALLCEYSNVNENNGGPMIRKHINKFKTTIKGTPPRSGYVTHLKDIENLYVLVTNVFNVSQLIL